MSAVEKIDDLEKLHALQHAPWTATTVAQMQALLSGKMRKKS